MAKYTIINREATYSTDVEINGYTYRINYGKLTVKGLTSDAPIKTLYSAKIDNKNSGEYMELTAHTERQLYSNVFDTLEAIN